MPSSLSTLANNLPKDDFHVTKKNFATENLKLVIKKNVFRVIIWLMKVNFKKELFHQNIHFSSKLETSIIDEMYEHAQDVWKEFNVKTLGEYSDIYLKIDVLILCDIFESFLKLCMET